MELSEQVQELLQRYRFISKQNEDSIRNEKINLTNDSEMIFTQDDLINVDQIDFSNDETWLCDSSVGELNKTDLNRWLYQEADVPKNMVFQKNHVSLLKEMSSLKKNIDTRTFTRPKKKYTRPSIEKYNEELYEVDRKNEDESATEMQNLSVNIDRLKTEASPVHFDLSQPVSRDNFDNILSGSVGVDSFVNMSPPSLVTSLCSSTFTNLMENSFIKSDPVLREIRDTDFSNEVLIQDSDPPLFQSFTESCSSLNSDSAEAFLRQTLPTLNSTFHKNFFADTSRSDSSDGSPNSTLKHNANDNLDVTRSLNRSFQEREATASNISTSDLEIQDNLNNTFKRNVTKDVGLPNDFDLQDEVRLNLNETFQKPSNMYNHIMNFNSCKNEDEKSSNSSITDVYFNTAMSGNSPKKYSKDLISRENIDPNTTITIPTVQNGTFRKDHKMNNKLAHNNKNFTYINNLSDKFNGKLGSKIVDYNIKDERKSAHSPPDTKRHSIGYVTGSTDSLDHMSSLSNSSRGSNRMLNMAEVDAIVELQERSLQVMSTPKPAKSMSKLFEAHVISPIVRQKEHVSDSDLSSTDDFLTVRSSLSKASSGHSEKNLKTLDRSQAKSLSNLKQNSDLKFKPRGINTITKAVSSLQTDLKPAEGNLRIPKSIGMRGSYTNLKPIGLNLPVIMSKPNSAPAATRNLNVTITKTDDEVFKIPVAPSDQLKPVSAPAHTTAKPQGRVSNLPRPVGTGIPRPVSKIPGPRTLRPPSVRPLSKTSITDGFF